MSDRATPRLSQNAPFDRRALLAAGLGAGLGLGASLTPAVAAPKGREQEPFAASLMVPASAFGLEPNAERDQSDRLQGAIDQTSVKGQVLALPGGRYAVGNIVLRPGTRIVGAAGATILSYTGMGSLLTAKAAATVRLSGLVLDGMRLSLNRARTSAVLSLAECTDVLIDDIQVIRAGGHGIVLNRVAGAVRNSSVIGASEAGIFSTDALGLEITANTVADCGDNGILLWRSARGNDGTLVSANRIRNITNRSGGTGQYGNGINIYRAGNVVATGNTISDCTYSAIRANTADNVQMIGNSAHSSGEVALYAEFGFEGALIANNLVDTAATGIAVTNFNEGGRLAVIQGNIVRNLLRREREPKDKRGEGIGVEADAVVASNVIENAPTAGLVIGWGKYMREVVATGNLIRKSRIGIAVTGDAAAGACLIANNMISGASDGGIRAMDYAQATGSDLAGGRGAPRNVTLAGNVVA